MSYYDTLKTIYNDFKLIKNNNPETKLIGRSISLYEHKPSTTIDVVFRDWLNCDTYWQEYGIDFSLLKRYDIYPLQEYWINGWKKYTHEDDNPAYSFEFGEGKRKILSPYSDYKWLSNTSSNIFSGYKQLDENGDILIITSSLKDVMVLRKLGYNAIAPQAETNKISKEIIDELRERFDYIYLNYDNDFSKKINSGQIFAQKIIEQYPDIINIYIPDEFECKDISDVAKTSGITFAKQLIDSLI